MKVLTPICPYCRQFSASSTAGEREWIRRADQLPTRKDADCAARVWGLTDTGAVARVHYKDWIEWEGYVAWMPTGLRRPDPPDDQIDMFAG